MNRTIKFRGKRLDNGEWVYGELCTPRLFDSKRGYFGEDVPCIFCDEGNVPIIPATVGQFTGLLDKNGKEIYEGDIITVNGQYPRVVLWDKMCWALMPTEYYHDKMFWVMNLQHPGPDWWDLFSNEFEVIGNIYDNPELLKGGDE